MIIKVKQVRAYGQNGLSISVGPMQLYESKDSSIKYEAYVNENLYGQSFFTPEKKISAYINATGNMQGKSQYNFDFSPIECPEGFEKYLIGYKKDLGNKSYLFIHNNEFNVYENGQLVGKTRRYYLERPRSLFTVNTNTYYAAIWKGQNYFIYPLKVEKSGYYYLIYQNDKMISTIQFDNFKTSRSEYTIYALNEADSDFLFLTICLLDFQNLESFTEGNKTTPPEFASDDPEYFKNKFDPNFIDKVKANN